MNLKNKKINPQNRQRGSSLLVSLVMLVVLTLLVVSAIRISTTNLKTVGNMQSKNETIMAAQQAVEQVLSNLNNFTSPVAIPSVPIDINGDGVPDFSVAVAAPVCINSKPVAGYGIDFIDSVPKDTYWDVTATVTDSRTGASSIVHQGVKMRLDASVTC